MAEDGRISQVIFDYAAKIGRAADTDAVLQLNAAMARDLVGADRCSIWLIDARTHQLWTKVAQGTEEIRIPAGEGIVGACIATNSSILVNDTSQDPRFRRATDAKTGYATHSVLAIPLAGASHEVIGALQLLNKPGGFDQADVELLGIAGTYSATAIETQMLRQQVEAARLVHRELEIARTVQNRLLPQALPVYPGLECAVVCRPAREVGGDFYDFIPLPIGELLFTVGDVSGKGIAAAVLMAGVQASVRSLPAGSPEKLASLVADYNRAVFSFTTPEKYATLFTGLIDRHMRLTYVNAAQEPPVLLRANGTLERLEVGGTAVGMFAAARYHQATVTLHPGDAVVCFSDGISEATNDRQEIWDPNHFLALCQKCAPLSAQETVERLVAAADEFTGNAEQADDMTMLVLKAV